MKSLPEAAKIRSFRPSPKGSRTLVPKRKTIVTALSGLPIYGQWTVPTLNLASRCREIRIWLRQRTEDKYNVSPHCTSLDSSADRTQNFLSAEKAAISVPATISAPGSLSEAGISLPAATASLDPAAQPATESSAALPEAPVPVEPVAAPAPMAYLNPDKRMKVSVSELIAENRRKQMMWKGLAIASSGAATFDAWSTRQPSLTTVRWN